MCIWRNWCRRYRPCDIAAGGMSCRNVIQTLTCNCILYIWIFRVCAHSRIPIKSHYRDIVWRHTVGVASRAALAVLWLLCPAVCSLTVGVVHCIVAHCCCAFVRFSSDHGTSQFTPVNMQIGFAQYHYFCITLLSAVMLWGIFIIQFTYWKHILGRQTFSLNYRSCAVVMGQVWSGASPVTIWHGPGMVRCQSCNNMTKQFSHDIIWVTFVFVQVMFCHLQFCVMYSLCQVPVCCINYHFVQRSCCPVSRPHPLPQHHSCIRCFTVHKARFRRDFLFIFLCHSWSCLIS